MATETVACEHGYFNWAACPHKCGEKSSPQNYGGNEKLQVYRVQYTCQACGEITSRKNTELPPERCPLCACPMFLRPVPEEEMK